MQGNMHVVDIELYRADENKNCLYAHQKSVKITHREITGQHQLSTLKSTMPPG